MNGGMRGGLGAALPLGDFTAQAGAARGAAKLPALPFPPAAFALALRAQLLLAAFAAAWWRRRGEEACALDPPRRTAPGTESLRAQVTALMSVIPMPAHPAFPSNHSLQAHLIAHLLTEAFPETPEAFEAVREPLLRLAGRIARNR